MVLAAAPDARAVGGQRVLRRSRRRARACAAASRRRSRAACCSSTRGRCTRVMVAERRHARAEDQGASRCRTGRRAAASSSTLFTKLASQVDPEFRPFARRGERVSGGGQRRRHRRLRRRSPATSRKRRTSPFRSPTRPARASTARWSIAVFGRIRDEPTRRNELARRRIGAHAAPGGPWEVKDVSQTGLQADRADEVANAVTLGTLVAIRPHGQPRWTLGIIRRMKRTAADRAEIGCRSSPTRSPPSTSSSSASAVPTNIRSTAKVRRSTGAGSARCCWRCARATPSRWCNR